ncbi:LAMI_0B03686g1_1 [Lachancea mirantina]|uniref:LAMI_0B03686g1_1 n=1 Tax=Lachancea mirantina TaxID=1230905 RepID=A0A1G4IUX6_9SACH|nr:LAMI_0B03686g1_1 [Lachancea mirantina]
MMMRTNSEQSGNRPYSSNNPFRLASIDSDIQLDQPNKDTFRGVSRNGSYASANASTYARPIAQREKSAHSFADNLDGDDIVGYSSPRPMSARNSFSMTPPPRPASNNPFLEDLDSNSVASGEESELSSSIPSYHGNGEDRTSYPTAQEEKARLRQQYIKQTNVSEPSSDLPPSYEEVAASGPKKTTYPREKSQSTGYKSSGSHYSSRSGERPSHHRQRESKERGEHSADRDHDRRRSSRRRESGGGTSPHKGHRTKDKKGKKVVPPKNVDTIDKLDVTGLFGGAFHHDGPFDACTPHRNRNNKVAPVMAFPVDGPNSSISGVSNNKSAMNEVFGRDETEDDDLYGKSKFRPYNNNSSTTISAIKPDMSVTQFDTSKKTELVHGPTTVGLGSTTFLDGAPAAQSAIREDALHQAHGIQRKKSLSNRLKNASAHRQDHHLTPPDGYRREPLKLAKTHSGHLEYDNNDDGEDAYLGLPNAGRDKKESTGNKLMRRVKSLKVSRKS